ncbi:MAG: alpha/beta fold hydrolase, partial [Euryarchaeota archaeon]|nr:alpha/beta fold hydrolase [Euryarchaeota archaeon]
LPWSPAEECARSLDTTVTRVLHLEKTTRVDLLGHSLGGIAARTYAKHLGGNRRVRTCISLGSPHHGTWAALPAAWLPGLGDLLPGSPFLAKLNAGPEPHGVRQVSIYSLTDPACLPPTTCHLPGAVNHRLMLCNHNQLLTHPRAYRWMRDHLE